MHSSAHIELLAITDRQSWTENHLSLMVEHFSRILQEHRSQAGMLMTHHLSQPWKLDAIQKLGFEPLFRTFEMESDLNELPLSTLPEGYSASEISPERFDEYYDVLIESFSKNPETSIGSREESRAQFQKRPIPTFGVENEGKLVGFCNFGINSNDGEGEIQTIGVMPEHRGVGLGSFLLVYACRDLKRRGVKKAILGVAVKNLSALNLYKDAGFVVTEEFNELRKPVIQ